MQEIAFPGLKFQTFSGGVCTLTPIFMHGMSATHMVFRQCCYTLQYIISQKSPFSKKCPPPRTAKSLKKAVPYMQERMKIGHTLGKSHISILSTRNVICSFLWRPPTQLSIFCSYSTHKVIFYYFLRSAIGDASARNMSSSADISFFINIYELQNFQRFSKQLFFA